MTLRPFARATLAAVALLAGCSGRHIPNPVTPGGGGLPPHVLAEFPAHLAVGVAYDTSPLWAAFDIDLDPATVSDHTVFLKRDDVREACTVQWEAATRRILVRPAATLRLRTTYTVVISSAVHGADGVALTSAFAWQFSTNSLRLPLPLLPANGAVNASVVVPLAWAGNDSIGDVVRYQIWTGVDSAAVRAHQDTPVYTGLRPATLTSLPWPFATPVYWTVRATNLTTNEAIDGPLWRFTTLDPVAAPSDTLNVPITGWGYTSGVTNICSSFTLLSTGSNTAMIQWQVGTSLPAGAEVEVARIDLNWSGRVSPVDALAAVWPIVPPSPQCGTWTASVFPRTDEPGGPLAFAATLEGPRVRMTSTRLASQVCGMQKLPSRFDGFLFRSAGNITYLMSGTAQAQLVLSLRHPVAGGPR